MLPWRYSIKEILLFLIFLSLGPFVHALSPVEGFKKQEQYGEVTNFRHDELKVDLGAMPSDLKFADLGPGSFKALSDQIKAKQEYGTMFGFKDWTLSGHQYLEQQGSRILILEGSYKDSDLQTVNFLEVYWASASQAGQYLVTSEQEKLSGKSLAKYLK